MSPNQIIQFLKDNRNSTSKCILDEKIIDERLCLEIKEKDKLARLKKVVITGYSDAFAINHDSLPNPSSSILKKHKSSATCDAIIFCILENVPYILVLDLKSSLSNHIDHKNKTKSGKNLISYLNCLLKSFEGANLDDWNIYYSILHLQDPKRITQVGISNKSSQECDKPAYIEVSNEDILTVRRLLNLPLI